MSLSRPPSQERIINKQAHQPFKILKMPEISEFLAPIFRWSLKIFLAISIPLVLYAALTNPPIHTRNLTRFFSSCPGCLSSAAQYPDISCYPTGNDTILNSPTDITHIQFGLGGSSKTWKDRRKYSQLWWEPNVTRGYVFLDSAPPENSSWPETSNSPPYKVSTPPPKFNPNTARSSDRIARILKESFDLRLNDVRWFVMGDDDTVFFKENLVSVLSKYDYREMYYIGQSSESIEQDVMHSYRTAFGGGGFAISYPLACELAKILDGCIERYHRFYGSDEKVAACVAELGVPFTRQPGFHQLDVRGDAYGLLAAHPVAPLVTLHHLDYVKPLFPGKTQLDSLRKLMQSYQLDAGRTIQQTICYDHKHKWSVSISWGYTAQLYLSLLIPRELEMPLLTFRTWRSRSEGPFVFNTRPIKADPCEQPIVYFLDMVEEVDETKTVTTYTRVVVDNWKMCNRSDYKQAFDVEKITVTAAKMGHQEWMKAPRRQCCHITNGRSMTNEMKVKIRSCRPRETITI